MNSLLKLKLIKMGPSKKYVKKANWRLCILLFVMGVLTVMHFDAMFKSPDPPTVVQYIATLGIILAIWGLVADTYIFGNNSPCNMDP